MAASDRLAARVATRHRLARLTQDVRALSAGLSHLATAELSGPLEQASKQMQKGSWGGAAVAIKAVLTALEVRETEIGSVRTIGAGWYYALGPRQRKRAMEIVRVAAHLLRWSNDDNAAVRMADQMETFAKEVAWVEKLIRKPSDSIKHGSFEIVPMAGVSRSALDGVLAALDESANKIRPRFPDLLYGKVFIMKTLSQSHFGSMAKYVPDDLYISLKAKGTVGDVHAICHEFGHRFEHRLWKNRAQRDEFRRLSTEPVYETVNFDEKLRKKLADEFIEILHTQMAGRRQAPSSLLGTWLEYVNRTKLHKLRGYIQKALGGDDKAEKALHKTIAEGRGVVKVPTSRKVRGPLHVTPYGAKVWTENFAEAFAYFVLGKPLPAEIGDIMSNL